jgi:AcrR family transcriptional regulator
VEAAGVTKPALYYWFGSKEGIFLALVGSIDPLYNEKVSILTAAGGSARERIRLFLTGMFDGARQNLPLVRLAYAIFYGPPQGSPPCDFTPFFDRTLELVRALVVEGMAAGEFARVNPDPAAWALVGSYHTIIEEQFCHCPPRMDRQGLEQVINLILDGLTPSAAANGGTIPGVVL